MKKFLLALCALFICMATFAGDNLKIKSGKASFMKEPVKVCIVLDWSNATWDNKIDLKSQLNDEYDKYLKEGEQALVEGFKDKAKKVTYTADASEAQYQITIKVKALDYFYGVMSFIPGHKHKITADITATNTATGEEVYRAYADTFEGGRDFVKYDSYIKMMRDTGEKLGSFK